MCSLCVTPRVSVLAGRRIAPDILAMGRFLNILYFNTMSCMAPLYILDTPAMFSVYFARGCILDVTCHTYVSQLLYELCWYLYVRAQGLTVSVFV